MKLLATTLLVLTASTAWASGTWVDRAPVVSARPLYATSPACHPEAARRLGQSTLVQALEADLARADCEARARVVTGWHVTYRYGGREYQRIMDHQPGRFVEVEVQVHAGRP